MCIILPMRLIDVHRKLSVLLIGAIILITGGCTGDSLNDTKQLSLSTTPPVEETSYTSKVTNALGSYYDNTVTFLTEDCGAGAYTTATGKALFYGVSGGLWGASKGSLYGVTASDTIEGLVIGSIVGSSVGLVVGVKNAYEGFKADTASCS